MARRRPAHHFDRAFGVRDYGLRDGAQEQAFPGVVTMRADYDQIRLPLVSFIQDHSLGRTHHDLSGHRHVWSQRLLQPGQSCLQHRVCAQAHRSFDLFEIITR